MTYLLGKGRTGKINYFYSMVQIHRMLVDQGHYHRPQIINANKRLFTSRFLGPSLAPRDIDLVDLK
jgi:hypothetical protein